LSKDYPIERERERERERGWVGGERESFVDLFLDDSQPWKGNLKRYCLWRKRGNC
jgi:hypothetical protein